MKRCYFAHPMGSYGSEKEREILGILEASGFDIINPNQEDHQIAGKTQGIVYFENLVKECDSICFMRYPNGDIGAGIGAELNIAIAANHTIYDIVDKILVCVNGSDIGPILSIEETKIANRAMREGK